MTKEPLLTTSEVAQVAVLTLFLYISETFLIDLRYIEVETISSKGFW